MHSKVVNVLSNSDVGTQDITFTADPAWTPKVAIVQYSPAATSSSAFTEGASFGYGFTDGTNSRCIAYVSEDAVTNSDTARIQSNNSLITGLNKTGTITGVDAVATFTQWLDNGMQITWSNAPATPFYITVTFLGGSDLTNAEVGTLMTTTGASCSKTGMAWQPDFGMFLYGNFVTENSGSSTTPSLSIGAAKDSSNQWNQTWSHADASGTSAAQISFSHGRVVVQRTTSLTGYSVFSSWNADGFTLNNTDTYAVSHPIYYLVTKGGQVKVGNAAEPAGTGNQTVTTSTDVKSVFLIGADVTSADTITASGMWSSGAGDGTTQGGFAVDEVPASDPMANAAGFSTSYIYSNITANATATSSVVDDQASLGSVSSTGFVINWNNIGQTRPFRYITFGGALPNDYSRPISEPSTSVSENLDPTFSLIKSISEPAVSVSADSIDDIESYQRPIEESPPVTVAADSIESVWTPSAPANAVYDVHFVEFPEDISDSIEVPAPFQLTSVTVDKTHKYSILQQVTNNTNKTHVFSVLQSITKTKTHLYNVLTLVTTTKTHKYNLLQQVTTIKSHLYNVIGLVTRTLTHKYDLIGKITQTKTHKYNLLQTVPVTKTHVFSVLNSISRTVTHKFDVLQQVIRTRTHKYNVSSSLVRISTTKTHKYDIESPFISVTPPPTKTHKFSILEKVTKTKTHVFSVLEQVTTTKTHKYNVIKQVQTLKTHKFSVIIATSSNKTHIFSVLQRVDTLKTHKFSVLEQIVKTKTHKFSLAGRVITTKTHKYDIEAIVGTPTTTKTHKFSIIERITKTKTHIFAILEQIIQSKTHKFHLVNQTITSKTHKFNTIQKITTTKTHKFTITNRVTPDLTRTHKFSINTLASRTRTHKFNLVGRLTKTKTHRYGVGGGVSTTKTHRFEVGSGVILKELGGSTNAFVRFQDRIRIIDIISDLNNTAIANIEIITARPPTNIAIATVAIAEEYSSKLLTASVYKPRHRVASTLITPQIIDTIDNHAVAPYIGIEILPLSEQSQFQVQCNLLIADKETISLQSLTQIKQDDNTKIRIASATMLQQTQETIIGSKAQLEIPPTLRPIVAPEIMTRQKAKILKTLINLLSNNALFG